MSGSRPTKITLNGDQFILVDAGPDEEGNPQFRVVRSLPATHCPHCGKKVGYGGRVSAWLRGASVHGCDFSLDRKP
jgi:hypothetical protein